MHKSLQFALNAQHIIGLTNYKTIGKKQELTLDIYNALVISNVVKDVI